MKKTQKRILGLIGLALVVVITIWAIFLPDSGASALETNQSTDEVKVRVVGSTPMVKILYPENDTILVDPIQYFQFDYENVATTVTEIHYTDFDGNEHIYIIDTEDPNYHHGTSDRYPLDLSEDKYGYGYYQIVVKGVGHDGVTTEDTIKFSYYPVYGKITDDDKEGTFGLDFIYDDKSEKLASIMVNVYDSAGNLVVVLSHQKVLVPGTEVILAFAENGLPFGDYTVEIIGLDAGGNALSIPYYLGLRYEGSKPDDEENGIIVAPDTGYFWGGTNISGTDIVATGLVAFLAAAALAVAVVVRTKKEEAKQNS